MCGISGIAGTSAVNIAAVAAMNKMQAHRGPDGEGSWQSHDGKVCLGHRRLAILAVGDSGAQPMQDESKQLTITFNGEIYNYRELRHTLSDAGIRFRTSSDTEVLLAAYAYWGEACVEKLNGMFAFAIHDARNNILFCARDRFGEKPFLFAQPHGAFVFASEYKGLFAVSGISVEPNTSKLLRFSIDPTDALDQTSATLFDDVYALPPGNTLVLSLSDLSYKIACYWQLPVYKPADVEMDSRKYDSEAIQTEFRALLEDSVRLRLRSDVKLGSCLSGGLDSSAVTYIANTQLRTSAPDGSAFDYHVFTGRFPNSPADEGEWADLVGNTIPVKKHETFPTADNLVAEIDDFVWFNELPVDSTSQYAQWCVFREAKQQGITVLLDGQGADEILGGYESYFAGYLRSIALTPDWETQAAMIEARYPGALAMDQNRWKSDLPIRLKQFVSDALGIGTSMTLAISPEMQKHLEMGIGPDANADLHSMLLRDSGHGFLSTLLRYGDRNSMAHSREVRLPFCDHRIAEFAFQMPPQVLMGEAQTKRLLRAAMSNALPEPILSRWRKQGFLPPIQQWLRGSLGELASDTFASVKFQQRGFWRTGWLTNAMSRFAAGESAVASSIWKALITELWFQKFQARINAMQRQPALLASNP